MSTHKENAVQNEIEEATLLYRHVKELSQISYDSELRREDSLIQQSSHMQTAFSFMTAALFMAAPILIDNRDFLSLGFFFVAFSTIVLCLLISLVFASLAQRRRKTETFPSINVIENFVNENWECSLSEAQQLKQWVVLVGKVQKSKENINDMRVNQIRASMGFFFASIGFIVFWYFTGLSIIFNK